jgi:hypothetical protein
MGRNIWSRQNFVLEYSTEVTYLWELNVDGRILSDGTTSAKNFWWLELPLCL